MTRKEVPGIYHGDPIPIPKFDVNAGEVFLSVLQPSRQPLQSQTGRVQKPPHNRGAYQGVLQVSPATPTVRKNACGNSICIFSRQLRKNFQTLWFEKSKNPVSRKFGEPKTRYLENSVCHLCA